MTLTMPERGLDDAAAFARLGRPDAVLFDWDHTLVDAWGAILAAYNDVMIAYGKPPALTPEEGRLRIRRSMRDTFPEIFGDRWQEAALRFKAAYAARHLETVVAMEGAADLLDLLAGQGIPLGVVSNKQGPFLRAEVAHLGWGERFGALLGAGDAARDKPDAASSRRWPPSAARPVRMSGSSAMPLSTWTVPGPRAAPASFWSTTARVLMKGCLHAQTSGLSIAATCTTL